MPPIHSGMVAGNGGLVPLPNGDWHAMAVNPNAPPPVVRGVATLSFVLAATRVCVHGEAKRSHLSSAVLARVGVLFPGRYDSDSDSDSRF